MYIRWGKGGRKMSAQGRKECRCQRKEWKVCVKGTQTHPNHSLPELLLLQDHINTNSVVNIQMQSFLKHRNMFTTVNVCAQREGNLSIQISNEKGFFFCSLFQSKNWLMHSAWHSLSLCLLFLMLFCCSPWKKSVLIWLHGPNVLSDRRDEKEMHLQIYEQMSAIINNTPFITHLLLAAIRSNPCLYFSIRKFIW